MSFPQLIEVREDGSFAGFIAPLYQALTDPFFQKFGNMTKFVTATLGDLVGDPSSLDGCMGRLQRNESDFALPFMEYPITVSGIRQSTFMFPTKVAIVSAYNNTPVFGQTDVMDAFHSFKRSLWTLTSVTALLMTILVLVGISISLPSWRRPERRSKKESIALSVHVTIGNILKQHSSYNYPCKHHYQKIIITFYAMFSFLMIFFFSSMIKTEMVVQKDPFTITSYNDVIESGVQPLFIGIVNDHTDFKYASSGSKEGQIWQLAHNYGLESCMISSMSHVTHYLPHIISQTAVWIVAEYIGDLFLKNYCPFVRAQGFYPDSNALIGTDDIAAEKIVGIAFSSSMSQMRTKQYLDVTTALMETGLIKAAIRRMEFQASPDTGSKSLRECLANQIIHPDSEFHAVVIAHYRHLFLVSGYMIMLIFFVLMAEFLILRFTQRKEEEAGKFEVLASIATQMSPAILVSRFPDRVKTEMPVASCPASSSTSHEFSPQTSSSGHNRENQT